MIDKDYVCEDRGTVREWTQIKVTVPTETLDTLIAVMSMVSNNLMIEDFSDIDLNTCYGELIDESILNADTTNASVSVYLPAEDNCAEQMEFIRDRLAASGIEGKVELIGVNEEDWADSWKQYYKPIRIGRRVVVVPHWEKYEARGDDIIVRMDPGMAFGTGTHETTRLVMQLLEDYTKADCRLLDVGCGSGILAICAAKLGAGFCRAYDIDPVAVKVAQDNVQINEVDHKVECAESDLLAGVSLEGGQYDIICANIVADIIIRMSGEVASYLKDDGVLLASGIIASRGDDVVRALEAGGLKVMDSRVDNDWCAFAFGKKQVN